MNEEIKDIAAEQGWTDETLLDLVLTWVTQNGHSDALVEHLEAVATGENDEGDEEEVES